MDGNAIRLPLLGLIKTEVICCNVDDYKLWNKDTEFSTNNKFTSKRTKINCNVSVNIGQVKISDGAKTLSDAEVEKDRLLKLQSTIVRIMKSNKLMAHNDLIIETTNQCRVWFPAKVNSIKKAIEYLIEQQYIKRKDGDMSQLNHTAVYEYIA
eukprot:gene14607-17272_t